jgi:hypothetical protein
MTAVDAVLFDLDHTICVYERSADDVLSVAFDEAGVQAFFSGEEYAARIDLNPGPGCAHSAADTSVTVPTPFDRPSRKTNRWPSSTRYGRNLNRTVASPVSPGRSRPSSG